MSSKGSAKKNGGMAKGRSNREKLTLSIRKEKREGGLAKRRMEAWGEKNEETTPAASSSADGSKKTFSVSNFPGMVEGVPFMVTIVARDHETGTVSIELPNGEIWPGIQPW